MKRHVVSLLVVIMVGILLPALPCGGVEKGKELIEVREGHELRPRVVEPTDELIKGLTLPAGFTISKFADGLGKPRMMTVGEDGTVYVTRRDSGDVLTLRDQDGDGKAEKVETVVRNLPGVHGIAIHDNKMYLCTVNEVYVADMKDGKVGDPLMLMGGIPPGGRHPNRTIAFGPDGLLYITVGSTCNCCLEEHPESAGIVRVKPDGSDRTLFAGGLRNTIGFGWHPVSKEMYGMDHGTDWLGDNFPPEELNKLEEGKHYGWPFSYADGKLIQLKNYPESFDSKAWLAKSTPSLLEYQAHSAPIQMVFYTGNQFPPEYRNNAFVAMHGSWNRKPQSGYEVVRIRFSDEGKPLSFEKFLTGFRLGEGPDVFGRPAGITVAKDGSLLVGCDATGVIYRVSYNK